MVLTDWSIVEGGEIHVFKGSSKILKTMRPIILCEVFDIMTNKFNYKAKEIYDYIKQFEYEWYINNDNSRTISKFEWFDGFLGDNLVAIPKEKVKSIKQEEQW